MLLYGPKTHKFVYLPAHLNIGEFRLKKNAKICETFNKTS